LKSLLHERFMYLYYTMIVMSLTTLLDKKSPLFSELCLQSERRYVIISARFYIIEQKFHFLYFQ